MLARLSLVLISLTLFLSTPSSFSAENTLVRVSQTLEIEVEGETSLTGRFTVGPDGQIQYPLLGEVFVEGLHANEVEMFLVESLKEDYLVNPRVHVRLVGKSEEPKKTKEPEASKPAPKKAQPVSSDHGQLKIEVENEADLTGTYNLSADGKIDFPLVGSLKVSGLNSEQIRAMLEKKLSADFLVNPKVSVQWLSKGKSAASKSSLSKGATPPAATKPDIVSNDSDPDFKYNLIRIGDKLNVQVYKEKDLSGIFTVGNNGKITYPLLGEILVEGLLLDELETFLKDNLKAFLVDPQVDINFEESLTKSVSLLGAVGKPGNYALTPDLTLIRLISQAGGFSADPSMVSVRISRSTREGKDKIVPVNFREIMEGKSADFKIEPNDVVYVEENKGSFATVSVLGQVERPGNYPPAAEQTLVRLISQAGGFTPVAAASRVRIVRDIPGSKKKKTLQVNANAILDGRAEDVRIEPGDIIVVPESFF